MEHKKGYTKENRMILFGYYGTQIGGIIKYAHMGRICINTNV